MTEVIEKTENKKGYKKTKLGWIPEEWEVKKLGDYFTLTSGITKPNDLHEVQEYNDNPVYGGNGIIGYSKQVLLNQNVLIIGRVGEKCGCVHYLQKPCWVTDNALYINSIKKNFNYKYMYYLLQKINLNKYRNKSGQPLVSQKPIYCTIIAMPKIAEQEKIAEILSAWDEGIETLEKLIETKKRYLKNIAIKLLSKGTNCSEWKEFSLGSISIPINEKVGEKTLPVLSITAGRGFVLQADKFGKNIAGNQYKNYTLLHKNEFSYNKGNSKKYAQGCIYCLKEYEEASVPNVFISFKLKNEIALNEYFEQLFKYNFHGVKLKKYINSGVRDDGLLNLNSNNFFKIKFKIPQIDEQQKIVNILNSYDEEIQILNSKLEKLKEQKKGLMQKLLTGQIRVKV